MDVPMLSRGSKEAASMVELRGECPREVVDVLDAVSMARNQTRTSLVNAVLAKWAEEVKHEASLVQRVLAGNPLSADR